MEWLSFTCPPGQLYKIVFDEVIMMKTGQKILIACDSSKSLIDFRGKLVEEMVKHHQVSVFTPQIPRNEIREKLASLKVQVYENKLKGSNVAILSDIRYIIKLYRLIKKVKPDVFFPYTFKPVIYGTLMAKICGVPMITPMLTGLGYNFTQTGNKSWVTKITAFMLKLSLRNSKRLRIIFQNRDDYLTLLKEKILKGKHKIFVVNGSGVDLDHYEYAPPNLTQINFLMISRLINAKGIAEYYEAARSLRVRYPHIQFKLIGAYDNNIDAISPELYNKIKYDKVIQFAGEVNDVRSYIKEASVVVLPSYYGEGVPRCLLESMAMGRAIITCDSVGCRETVEEGELVNGFLVPVKNVQALISKMELYINDPHTIANYGLNGLAVANKKFNVHLINKQMIKIMRLN
jgi:glycosyltransferase involved in cell wall biosynthesis